MKRLTLLLVGVMAVTAAIFSWRLTLPPVSPTSTHDAQLRAELPTQPIRPDEVERSAAAERSAPLEQPPSAGRGPETSPALIGVTAPTDAGIPQTITTLKDAAVLDYYKLQLSVIQNLEQKLRTGQTLSPAAKDNLAITRAVKVLMEQQRFWYLGPKATVPQYSQSFNTRYICTALGGTGMVFELTRGEFPDVFENDPRVFGK